MSDGTGENTSGSDSGRYRDRIVELRRVRAGDLQAHSKNWREHPPEQRAALEAILQRIGWADVAKARELEDGSLELIDGHLRKDIDENELVPTLIVDVTADEAEELLFTYDPLSSWAVSNYQALSTLLGSHEEAAREIWPPHLLEPLMAADWTAPAADDELPASGDRQSGDVIRLTPNQKQVVDLAVARLRERENDQEIAEGRAVELICADFLGGQ